MVMHGVTRLFVCLFPVLVVVYKANLVQLITPHLPAGLPQFVVFIIYDATRCQPIVVFLLKNVAINYYILCQWFDLMISNFYVDLPPLLLCSCQSVHFAGVFFLDASTPLPKKRVLTSAPPPMSSIKSTIPLQSQFTYILEVAGSLRLLSLSFNEHIFYKLFDILAYINNYPIGLEQVELYCEVVEQTTVIFDIGWYLRQVL